MQKELKFRQIESNLSRKQLLSVYFFRFCEPMEGMLSIKVDFRPIEGIERVTTNVNNKAQERDRKNP